MRALDRSLSVSRVGTMKRTFPISIDAERTLRLDAIREAYGAAGLEVEFSIPDCDAQRISIPAGLFVDLCGVLKAARGLRMTPSLEAIASLDESIAFVGNRSEHLTDPATPPYDKEQE